MTLLLAAALAVSLSADTLSCGGARLSWSPDRPRAGTFFAVRASGDSVGAPLSATIAGEALRFRELGSTRVALAPMPIDSSSVIARFTCGQQGQDTLAVRIAASAGHYAIERLSVDPRFASPPDSALSARLKREYARVDEVEATSRTTPILWSKPFTAPRPTRITSEFGKGRAFNGTLTSRHMGTDFAGQLGAPIRASNRGIVRLVDSLYYGGNVVYLDHGGGLITAYLHMSKQLVSPGDTVAQGALIGRVGATGRVTGPHLHLIARLGSITLDPMSLLAATAPPRRSSSKPPKSGAR